MSPLLRDELQVVLTPSQVLMGRTRKGVRHRLVTHGIADCAAAEPGNPAWMGALRTLAEQLQGMPVRRANLQVILSNMFVRYAIVPWQAGLNGATEDAAYVRHYFVHMFGSIAEGWDICVSTEPEGLPRLASAVDAPLLAALHDLCALIGIRLKAVVPQLASTFNRYRRSLSSMGGWMVLIEGGCLCIALFESGRWLSVRTSRLDSGWQQDLPILLEREACLANPDGEADQVFLWAPEQAVDTHMVADRFHVHSLLGPLTIGAEEWYEARFACGGGR